LAGFELEFSATLAQLPSLVLHYLLQPPRQCFEVVDLLLLVDDLLLHQGQLVAFSLVVALVRGAVRQCVRLIEYTVLRDFEIVLTAQILILLLLVLLL